MTRHARIPALLATLLSTAAGLGILAAAGQFRAADLDHASEQELEKRILGSTDGRIWRAYGDRLREAGKFANAAKAYQKALDFQPDLAQARVSQGVALAQAGDANGFFNYVNRLVMSYPKLAVDLLGRPEMVAVQGDARWEPTLALARAQAVD